MFVHVVYYYISLLHGIIDDYIHIQAYTNTIILKHKNCIFNIAVIMIMRPSQSSWCFECSGNCLACVCLGVRMWSCTDMGVSGGPYNKDPTI